MLLLRVRPVGLCVLARAAVCVGVAALTLADDEITVLNLCRTLA